MNKNSILYSIKAVEQRIVMRIWTLLSILHTIHRIVWKKVYSPQYFYLGKTPKDMHKILVPLLDVFENVISKFDSIIYNKYRSIDEIEKEEKPMKQKPMFIRKIEADVSYILTKTILKGCWKFTLFIDALCLYPAITHNEWNGITLRWMYPKLMETTDKLYKYRNIIQSVASDKYSDVMIERMRIKEIEKTNEHYQKEFYDNDRNGWVS